VSFAAAVAIGVEWDADRRVAHQRLDVLPETKHTYGAGHRSEFARNSVPASVSAPIRQAHLKHRHTLTEIGSPNAVLADPRLVSIKRRSTGLGLS
jgi:hypothetical protein